MLFNSWLFLCFVPFVYLLYYRLPFRAQNVMLLIASYIFYGAWDWRFLFLILLSTVIDFVIGQKLDASSDERARKRLIWTSVVMNLTVLAFFKYFNFFIENAESFLAWFGIPLERIRLDIVLPVGISFYTFQTISYSVDVYNKKIRAERNFLDYALFVAYFPQLVAGPIERAANLIPQLTKPRTITRTYVVEGLWLVLMGFFKKVVVADNIAFAVDRVFASQAEPSGLMCLFAMYGFTVQGYCDFAGYSDIARGLAKLMGIDIVVNFNMPLIARNPSEFWRRWHISLSFWLRDYLYIPLGGNKLGRLRTYINYTIVFVLSGLWHGATWPYVIWGFYNGVLTSVHRFLVIEHGMPTPKGKFGDIMARIFYFHLTCIGLLLIRAQDVQTVVRFLGNMITDMYLDFEASRLMFTVIFFAGFLGLIELWIQNADNPETRPGWRRGFGAALVALMLLSIVLLTPPAGQPFIYFQF